MKRGKKEERKNRKSKMLIRFRLTFPGTEIKVNMELSKGK